MVSIQKIVQFLVTVELYSPISSLQVLDGLDAGTILYTISDTQNTIREILEKPLDLQSEGQHYKEHWIFLKNDVNRDEETVQNGGELIAESEELLHEADSIS